MRSLLISLIVVLLAATIQAGVFKKEKVKLGKKNCLCDFNIEIGDTCSGSVKCDKKCSGSGTVDLGGCSFTLAVKKGKGKISKCSCEAATLPVPTEPTIGPGSGETPVPMTGSGSGETPVPMTGSGSGETPVPIPTSPGSGSGGEGMQCSCKCNCPDGSGECDCDCNCPMTSKTVTCAPGFSKVCPMMGDMCPQDMDHICPHNAISRMGGNAAEGMDKGCQCVPDFLLAMVMIQPTGRMEAVDRAMTKATIQVGKKKCKCSYEMNAENCKKSKIVCDKKCSGKESGVELADGDVMYMVDIAVKKGKVTIAKCDVEAPEPTETGGGSTGSGSGNGEGGMGGMVSRCACVSKGMGGSGPTVPTLPPTGSGSEPAPPTGSGSEPAPPTGSGSEPAPPTGSGSEPAPPTGSGSGSDSLRVRRNVNSLNNTEIHELLYALIAAKKYGSYKGPRINGTLNEHSSDFNSSFNAVASFHGYPGLCPATNIPANSGNLDASDCCWHSDSRFLPWHRLIVMQFDDALRSDDKYKNVVLPYWDWTQNFEELPFLIRNPHITDPLTKKTIENPFYHSQMPGIAGEEYTKRSADVLIKYNKGCTNDTTINSCTKGEHNYQGLSLLMNQTLLALEETTYINFERQIEMPHNQVHNQLGYVPYKDTHKDIAKCFHKHPDCYPYTMQQNTYASFDPIFMIFHTMVDFQWAVFQALQTHRGIPFESDCHPDFDKDLPPFSTNFNGNNNTKSHSRGIETVNYTEAFGYKYDNLTLNGMSIPELDAYLDTRNNISDRLFAGFSLPDMNIKLIRFNVCNITDCTFSDESFKLSVKNRNKNPEPGVYKNSVLIYHEVTHQLAKFGLTANQNIGFKIVSTDPEAQNVTFTPVSIFRKAGTGKDRITVHWFDGKTEFNYAPFFEAKPSRQNSIRFLLENGSMSVYQYKNKADFEACSGNRTLVHQEIEISGNQTYYFQNPLQMGCELEQKLFINMSKPCNSSGLFREKDGNAILTWQIDMSEFSNGICMTPGSVLTFKYNGNDHNVTQLQTETEYSYCTIPSAVSTSVGDQGPIKFPRSGNGFQEDENIYYIVCPLWNHCRQSMKIKICVKKECSGLKTCN